MKRKIVIAGGSGFLGTAIAAVLHKADYEIVVLTRDVDLQKKAHTTFIAWDGKTIGNWTRVLEGAAALINLTGRSINCVHSARNKQEIISSRVDSVQVLSEAFRLCTAPPEVWIQASAVGFYGDRGEEICTEQSAAGSGFLAECCKAWETAFLGPLIPTRRILLRFGFVLSNHGGGLPPLINITKLFLGGAAGSGSQYISWIHLEDLCEIVRIAVGNSALEGIFNVVAPTPVSNNHFMRSLRAVLHRPWCPPAPAWAIRIIAASILHVDAALVLTGQRCAPQRLIDHRYSFTYAELDRALTAIVNDKKLRS